ncbi:hypothetical protein L873DRAFT_1812599 [Choiromyces venosus 120613-1]|uniref:Uncharacterized protein n=1 Tax=Choiromyces venosus 120613-1 TaxID=1336337 RepID=A0A3N4JBH1_9PEZI|nr:hypothetical protein L873DRAFT_1812599 [Choiromyces venosus 120613-1]
MQQLKVLQKQARLGEEEEEVAVHKNKPIPPDSESAEVGWGSKERKRQCEAMKRAEEEAERRNLGEKGDSKVFGLAGAIGLLMARLKYRAVGR